MTEQSWKPELKGDIYCSPACGGGCTKVEFDRATKNGVELAARMGEGWKLEIWENWGWFSRVISPCGRIRIYIDADSKKAVTSYTAFLGPPKNIGGIWVETASTPEEAMQKVLRVGKRETAWMKGLFDETA